MRTWEDITNAAEEFPLANMVETEVLQFGARKYEPDNWRKGITWRACGDSLLRHTFKWLSGEDYDSESGLLHLAHMRWNTAVPIECGPAMDNRSQPVQQPGLRYNTGKPRMSLIPLSVMEALAHAYEETDEAGVLTAATIALCDMARRK